MACCVVLCFVMLCFTVSCRVVSYYFVLYVLINTGLYRLNTYYYLLEIFLDNAMHDKDEESLKGAGYGEQVPKHQAAICGRQTREYPVEPQENKDGNGGPEMGHLLWLLLFARNLQDFCHHHGEGDRVEEHQQEDWG